MRVFDCRIKPPPRELDGKWLAQGTGVPGAALRGVHLLLPGYGDSGPTLELFTYSETLSHETAAPNRRGYGHIAFSVDDVSATAASVLENGGTLLGKITEKHLPSVGLLTFVYVRDPEGNIIELQHWAQEPEKNPATTDPAEPL